jgi:hypothetical protein
MRLALLLAAVAAYLGLAVLGWNGVSAFFSHPSLIALAAVLFVLAGVFFSPAEISAPEYARTAETAGYLAPLR